jgi:hypothetical protein
MTKKGSTAAPTRSSAKIIPLYYQDSGIYETDKDTSNAGERGRHYLKIVLPAIPIAVLTLTFLIDYLIEVGDAILSKRTINPETPILATIVITAVVSFLCIVIYIGYQRITGTDHK